MAAFNPGGIDLREMTFQNVIDRILQPAGVKVGGYPDDIFLDLTDDEREKWICNICFQIAREAHECTNKHLFCNTCVFAWSMTYGENSQLCPMCRCRQPTYRPVKELDKQMSDRRISCPEKHCTFQAPLKVYLMHNHGRERFANDCTDLESLRPQRAPETRLLVIPGVAAPGQRVRQLRDQLSQGRLMLHQMMLLLHLEMQLRQQALNGFTQATEPHTRLQRLDEVLALNEQLNEVGTILSVLLSDPLAASRAGNREAEIQAIREVARASRAAEAARGGEASRAMPTISSSAAVPSRAPPPRVRPRAEHLGTSAAGRSSDEDGDESDSDESVMSINTARRVARRGIVLNTAGASAVAASDTTPRPTPRAVAEAMPALGTARGGAANVGTGAAHSNINSTGVSIAGATAGSAGTIEVGSGDTENQSELPRGRQAANRLPINQSAIAENMRLLRRNPERNALRASADVTTTESSTDRTQDGAVEQGSNAEAGITDAPVLPPITPTPTPRRSSVASSVPSSMASELGSPREDSVLPIGSNAHQLTMQEMAAVRVARNNTRTTTPGAVSAARSLSIEEHPQTPRQAPPTIANSVARGSFHGTSSSILPSRDASASRRRTTLPHTPNLRPSLFAETVESSATRSVIDDNANSLPTTNGAQALANRRPSYHAARRLSIPRSDNLNVNDNGLITQTRAQPSPSTRRASQPLDNSNERRVPRSRRAASISSATSRRGVNDTAAVPPRLRRSETTEVQARTTREVNRGSNMTSQAASTRRAAPLAGSSGQLLRPRRRSEIRSNILDTSKTNGNK